MNALHSLARPLVPLLALLAVAFAPAAAGAHAQCEFEVDANLRIDAERIVIEDRELGSVVIREAGALAIDGRDVDLDADQREAVDAYATRLRTVVPAVVELAVDGVEIGVTAVSEVFAALLGDDELPVAMRETLAEVRTKVDAGLGRRDDVWYVNRDGIQGLDEALESVEPAIEKAVAESVGALLIALGRRMNEEDGSLDERMNSFGERMAGLGDEIEARVERDAEGLESKAEGLCAQFEALATREDEMKARVPELERLVVLARG